MQCPCLAARSFAFAMPSVAMQRRSRSFLRFALTSLRCANPCSSIALLRAALCDALAVHSNAVPSQSCTILCPGISRRGHALPLPCQAMPRRSISARCTDKPLLRGASLCQAIALPSLAPPCLCFALRSFALPPHIRAMNCRRCALRNLAVLCRCTAAQSNSTAQQCAGFLCFTEAMHNTAIPPRYWPDRQRARVGAEM